MTGSFEWQLKTVKSMPDFAKAGVHDDGGNMIFE